MSEDPFRLVRHRENGGREVIAEPILIPSKDAAEVNRALVKTMYRLWPIKAAEQRREEAP